MKTKEQYSKQGKASKRKGNNIKIGIREYKRI